MLQIRGGLQAMVGLTRTGMSDPHLRPDLRAQNPLYEMAGSATGAFETQRCPYHAMSMQEFERPERERRWRAIVREEKHIVQPPKAYALDRIMQIAQMSAPRPMPVLRPSLALGYSSDRMSFHRAQSRLHRAALSESRSPEKSAQQRDASSMLEEFNEPRRRAHQLSRRRVRNR